MARYPCRTGGWPADEGNPGPSEQPAQQQEVTADQSSTRWVTIRMSQRGGRDQPGPISLEVLPCDVEHLTERQNSP